MPHPDILRHGASALVVVDVQEAFRHVIPDFALIVSRTAVAIRGFRLLEIPIIVTEQYPKGLGNTVEELQLVLGNDRSAFEKTTFSACGATGFKEGIVCHGIEQIVICGFETHICVAQTALGLLDQGYQVHVLSDCVASRFDYNRLAGLSKMRRAGVVESSTEMALFELLMDSRNDKFKEIQDLIR